MSEVKEPVILIPSYNPDQATADFLLALRKRISNSFIVVNDGSYSAGSEQIFEKIARIPDCTVLNHAVNLGKGRALKTGFNHYLNTFPEGAGVVTADGDGQHAPDDIAKCTEALKKNPESLILGVRDFSEKSVPWKSSFGNKLTMFFLSIVTFCKIQDTQTGLRGIPFSLMKILMNTPGERFEYETQMLLESRQQGYRICQIPIQTIYLNGNRETHFNPISDSLKIYGVIFRYLFSRLFLFSISGILSAVFDLALFSIFFHCVMAAWHSGRLFYSVLFARILSMGFNYTFNKFIAFGSSQKKPYATFARYAILCVIIFLASYLLTKTANLIFTGTEIVFVKAVIDIMLFFVSFFVQKYIVFKWRT